MKFVQIDPKDTKNPIRLHCTQLDLLTNAYKAKLDSLLHIEKQPSENEKAAKLEEAEKAKSEIIEFLNTTHLRFLIQLQK